MMERPEWPVVGAEQPPQAPARNRHVWVRPPLGRPGAKQGLVVTWRRMQRGASPPGWQALVVVVDDRFEATRIEWFWDTELEPVHSKPPC